MSDDSNDETMSAEEARLLAELRLALGPDAAPPDLVRRAEGLLAFADVDRELVELLDGAAAEPVGSRGPDTRGVLSFELEDGRVSLEVLVDGDTVSGQLLSGQVAEVELVSLDGASLVDRVDALGRFSLSPAPSGPCRLRLDDGSGRPLATEWFLL
jgi:hypothetical protein